jgi:hypothetical protein
MTLPNASKVGYLCLLDERNGQGWLSIYLAWNDNALLLSRLNPPEVIKIADS